MSLYLDTSVIVPLFVREANTMTLVDWIAELDQPLHVSDLAAAEFHSAISRLRRMGVLDPEQAIEVRAQFKDWCEAAAEPLQTAPLDVRTAGYLVQTPLPKLLTPDAIHLATCRRLELTFVTSDFDLLEIAEREGVRWINPGESSA